MFYLTTHSTHFIYGYIASDIWLRTILIVKKETRCHHIGYSYRLTARVLLYAPSHRQDNTYHSLCYACRGALAGMRNSSVGSTPWRIDPTTHRTMSEHSYHGATSCSRGGERELLTCPYPLKVQAWPPQNHRLALRSGMGRGGGGGGVGENY